MKQGSTMKKLLKAAIILSILTIAYYAHADNMDRYYGGGQGSPRSYIDTDWNQNFWRSYITTKTDPFPGPQGSAQNYPFPDPKAISQQVFQPSDGSVTNGSYNITNKTAITPMHRYKNVIVVDGTSATPKLNKQGKYIDKQGVQYEAIGSFNIPSQDASDIFIYFIFGQFDDTTTPAKNKTRKNIPIQTFNSQGE